MSYECRYGLVGYGAMAEAHVAALKELGARCVAVAGPQASAAGSFAKRHQIRQTYIEVERLFDMSEIDAIVVASPTQLHARQTLAALAADKHVLCEIPIATSLSDAEQIARAVHRTARRLMVCHTERYQAPLAALKCRLTDRHLSVCHVVGRSMMWRHENVGATGRRRSWVDNLLWHHGCHLLDTAMWLLEEEDPHADAGFGQPWPSTGLPMDISITLKGDAGGVASLALSYNAKRAIHDYLVLTQEESFIVQGRLLSTSTSKILDAGHLADRRHRAVIDQDREFLAAIDEDRSPAVSIDVVLPVMRVLQTLQDVADSEAIEMRH